MRKQYPGHVQKMFELLGEPKEAAARDAQTVLDIETGLAKVSLDRVKRRDPANVDHKMTRKELAALAPDFDWDGYFTAIGTPAFTEINVGWPDFFKGMSQLLDAAQPRRLEDLPPLACRSRRRPAAARGFRQRELRLLRQDPQRRQGAPAALEALRRAHRPAARRGPGPALRGGHLRARGQGAHVQNGGRPRGRSRPRHPRAALDDRGHQEAGPREAAAIANKIGYPDQLAGLLQR